MCFKMNLMENGKKTFRDITEKKACGFTWLLLGRGSALGLDWGRGMVNGFVPGESMGRLDVGLEATLAAYPSAIPKRRSIINHFCPITGRKRIMHELPTCCQMLMPIQIYLCPTQNSCKSSQLKAQTQTVLVFWIM